MEIDYLINEICGEGVKKLTSKIQGILEFIVTSNVHKVREFVGLALYFRKLVRGFLQIASPFTDLTENNVV